MNISTVEGDICFVNVKDDREQLLILPHQHLFVPPPFASPHLTKHLSRRLGGVIDVRELGVHRMFTIVQEILYSILQVVGHARQFLVGSDHAHTLCGEGLVQC